MGKKIKYQVISKKIITTSVVLGVLSVYLNEEILKILSICQYIYILNLLKNNKIKKAYIYHIIFILSSISFPVDLDSTSVISYSKMKILGPISLSYIGVLSILIKLLALRKKISLKKTEFNYFLLGILLLNLLGISMGIIGIILDNYNTTSFIRYSVYGFNLLVNGVLLSIIFRENIIELKKVIISIMIASPLITVILLVFNKTTIYGSVERNIITEVFNYTPLFLLFPLYNKNNKIFFLGIISIFLGLKSFDGKGFLNLLLVLIIIVIKNINNFRKKNKNIRNKNIFLSIIIFIMFLLLSILTLKILNDKNVKLLGYHKLNQIVQMIGFFFGRNELNIIPISPRVRIASVINIALEYKNNILAFPLGFGYGGYFNDYFNFFKTLNNQAAFSEIEIILGKYSNPHDTIPTLFLHNGVLGMLFLGYWSFRLLKKISREIMAISGLSWLIYIYGFNHHHSLFGISCIFIALASKKRRRYLNERNTIS